jgi:HAD superfamily hydrolase (TIGR01509 family)
MAHAPVEAVLFDIDGTLVDSNYHHVQAWQRTFDDLELRVDAWRIHRGIGLDSARLLETLLGEDGAERYAEKAKELHTTYYQPLMASLRPFDGATALLRRLADTGFRVVLATSAPQEELDRLREILQIEDAVDAVTSAEDVEVAKPEPDLVRIAIEKAGVDASAAVMIGDSSWDAVAASRAGIRTLGVRSGGFGADELTDAGAVDVYDDVADLLKKLDASILTGRDAA